MSREIQSLAPRRSQVVPDFLPRPQELVFRDEGVKITIALSKRSVEFFKGEVQKT